MKVQDGASPYKKLMAQGTITHILRECQAKQRASSSLLLAKQRSDTLFAAENDALQYPECTFLGNDSNKNGMQFRNLLKARPASKSPASVVVDLEEERESSTESCAVGRPNANEVVSENSTAAVEEGETDLQSLSTEHSDNLADGSDGHIGIEAVPASNGANYHHLPFSFMPGTSSSSASGANCGAGHQPFANTPPVIHCRNISFNGTLGQSSSPRRHLYKSANSNDILTSNYYSPIRPRASQGPKMARIETPLSHASFSFAERMQQQSRTPPPPLAPASPLYGSPFSPQTPFDFMSEQQYQTEKEQSNPSQTKTNHPVAARPKSTSPLHTLATTVKSIFNFFAMKVLYYKFHQRGNSLSNIDEGHHKNSSSSKRTDASDTLPKHSPRSFMHRVPIVPSQSNSYRSFEASTLEHRRPSRYSPLQLPLPQPSNRAFLFNHNGCSSSVNVQAGGISTTAPRQNKQGRDDHNIQSSSSSSHSKATPPSDGWKSLFQPKEGEWKCEFCYYVNPSEAMTCDSCTALKEPPKSILRPSSYHSSAETGTGFSEADITGIEKDDGSYNDDDSYFASDDDYSSDDEDESEAEDDVNDEENDGSPSKRVKVSSSIDNPQQQWQQVNGNAEVQAIINQGHHVTVEEDEQRTQPTRSGSGKRIKVRYDQGPNDKVGDQTVEAMSTEPMSKKRGSDDEPLIPSSKAARAHVESMAMDDSSLNDLSTNEMDVE